MAFANGKKIKLVAGFVASKLIYLKKSKSYFQQSEIKGKKLFRNRTRFQRRRQDSRTLRNRQSAS